MISDHCPQQQLFGMGELVHVTFAKSDTHNLKSFTFTSLCIHQFYLKITAWVLKKVDFFSKRTKLS